MPRKALTAEDAEDFRRVCRGLAPLRSFANPRGVLCVEILLSRIWLFGRGLENGRSLGLGLVVFGLIRWKIFLIDVNDLHLRAELTIAAEQNLVARLLSLPAQPAGQLDHRARRQQMLLLVDRDPIVIDRLAGGSNRKSGIDFRADVFQTQHAVILPIDPDAAPIAG